MSRGLLGLMSNTTAADRFLTMTPFLENRLRVSTDSRNKDSRELLLSICRTMHIEHLLSPEFNSEDPCKIICDLWKKLNILCNRCVCVATVYDPLYIKFTLHEGCDSCLAGIINFVKHAWLKTDITLMDDSYPVTVDTDITGLLSIDMLRRLITEFGNNRLVTIYHLLPIYLFNETADYFTADQLKQNTTRIIYYSEGYAQDKIDRLVHKYGSLRLFELRDFFLRLHENYNFWPDFISKETLEEWRNIFNLYREIELCQVRDTIKLPGFTHDLTNIIHGYSG